MQSAINQFRINIERVRNLGAIFKALSNQTTGALDLSDILRAELVLAVSALDHYVHEVTRLGMLECYRGTRNRTSAFLKFQVSLESALQGIDLTLNNNSFLDENWLDDQIRVRHGYQSFQQAEKIADAIRLISEASLWSEVAQNMGQTSQDIKRQLQLIVERRNKIAHEADIDQSFPAILWPITAPMVDASINLIEQVVESIHRVVT